MRFTLKLPFQLRLFSTNTKSAPIQKKASKESSYVNSSGRTYRETLYSGRRISLWDSGSVGMGLSILSGRMKKEGIRDKVFQKRQWIPPGLVKSLETMKNRQKRFNKMVKNTIEEINEVYKRIQ